MEALLTVAIIWGPFLFLTVFVWAVNSFADWMERRTRLPKVRVIIREQTRP